MTGARLHKILQGGTRYRYYSIHLDLFERKDGRFVWHCHVEPLNEKKNRDIKSQL